MPLILDENQSSTGFFDIFHDSWNAFPTFVLIDHTMTVRAKPWTLENNSNTSSCDGSNSYINGWSGGSTYNFLQQLVNECGDLCINGGCSSSIGDVNEDEILNIQDLITMVNHILGSYVLIDCALEVADMNIDGIVNIQDLISLVNAILGNARLADLDGSAEIKYMVSEKDLVVNIVSDIDIVGIQLSIINKDKLEIDLKDNSHISQEISHNNGINRYIAYSMFNQPFDSKTTEIFIQNAGDLNIDNLNITVADINGDALYLSHSKESNKYNIGPHSFQLSKLYPNPFNPSTQVSFSLPIDSYVELTAFDIRGNEVEKIFEGSQMMGEHSYTWDASNLPSGIYYIHLQAGDMIASQKALLVK